MPLFIISLVIQVAFIVHVVKTGRNTTWIWIVLMLPLAGWIAYLVVEILPELGQSRAGRQAQRRLRKLVDPGRGVNAAMDSFERNPSIENSFRLAEELAAEGMHADAVPLYQQSLKGEHQHDPHIMLGLAQSRYALDDYRATVDTLDALMQHNPEFRNADAHLLYARATEKTGDVAGALHEYEVLHSYYPGPDATFHYANLVKEQGDHEKARSLFEEIVKKAQLSGRHYESVHGDIIRQAKAQLARA